MRNAIYWFVRLDKGAASKASIALEVYDLTKGETIEDALKKFDEGENHNPIYQFKLGEVETEML